MSPSPIVIVTFLLGIAAAPAAPARAAADADDLATLATWLTGSFSSAQQAAADTNYFDIRLRMAPMWTDRSDGPWIYVEQATATAQDRPYRQRVYRLREGGDGTFTSEVYALPGARRFAGAWRHGRPLATLTPDSLLAREGCAVVLRRAADGRFAGGTEGQRCASDLRGAAYATSEVTVGPDVIESWDRGFAADGSQAWGATGGGYVFVREPADAPWPLIARAAWLAGTWEMGQPGDLTEEHWLAPRGNSMLAVSRTVKGGRLAWFETVVLRETPEGLVFEAHPSGQPGGSFPAVTVTDSLLVFENPEHDFPQRIGYRRTGTGGVEAWIEGGGRRVEFPYRKSDTGTTTDTRPRSTFYRGVHDPAHVLVIVDSSGELPGRRLRIGMSCDGRIVIDGAYADTTRVRATTEPDSVIALVDDLLRLNFFNRPREYPREFGSAERLPDGRIGIAKTTSPASSRIGIRLQLGSVSRQVHLAEPAFGAPESLGPWLGRFRALVQGEVAWVKPFYPIAAPE